MRQFFRAEVPLQVTVYPLYKEDNNWYKSEECLSTYARNISTGGCLIKLSVYPFRSSYVLLDFIGIRSTRFNVILAKVVWSKNELTIQGELVFSFGIKFLAIDPDLEGLISRQALLKFPKVLS